MVATSRINLKFVKKYSVGFVCDIDFSIIIISIIKGFIRGFTTPFFFLRQFLISLRGRGEGNICTILIIDIRIFNYSRDIFGCFDLSDVNSELGDSSFNLKLNIIIIIITIIIIIIALYKYKHRGGEMI